MTEDTQVPRWFHVECFFKKVQTAREFDIQNFSTLSNSNKAIIRRHMSRPFISYQIQISSWIQFLFEFILSIWCFCLGKPDNIPIKQTGVAKKRPHENDNSESVSTVISDYRIETSATARNLCYCCFQTIPVRKVYIQKMVGNTISVWYDAKCFAKHCSSLGWHEAVESFPGFNKLSGADQEETKTLFRFVFIF